MDETIVVPDDFEYHGVPTFDQICETFNLTYCQVGYVYIKKRNNNNQILTEKQMRTENQRLA
eukprot:3220225-Prymnesium_polylepis.1